MSVDPRVLYEELLKAYEAEGPGIEGILSYTASEQCADPAIILNATAEDLDAAALYGEFTVLAQRVRHDAIAAVQAITGPYEGTLDDWFRQASTADREAVTSNLALLVGGDPR